MAIKRQSSIRVSVNSDTKSRLERLAHLLGVPPSTLAAVWLGQSIAQQERALSMVAKVADSVGGEVGAAMRDALQSGLFDASALAIAGEAAAQHAAQ